MDQLLEHFLRLLDRTLARQLRLAAVVDIEQLLTAPELSAAILTSFVSVPIPVQAELDGVAILVKKESAPRTAALILKLQAQYVAVQDAWRIWQRWLTEYFAREAQAAAVGDWFRTEQGWHVLVIALQTQSPQGFAAWCLQVARRAPPELGPQPIRLLNRLTEQLRHLRSSDTLKRPAVEGKSQSDFSEERIDPIGRSRIATLNRLGIFETVQTQLQAIVRAIERQELARATEFLRDLIQYHLAHGGPRYLVKSLSNLAAQARRLGALDFARHCSDLAVHYAPGDIFACNGRAEVLKAQGRLAEALFAYDQIIAGFPGNVIAHSGRAEVLKTQGRLAEALSAYDHIIAEFPDNLVARNSRADVFKTQGKLSEALAAYDQIIAEFPSDVIARNGRADVLKAQGKRAEALMAYEQIITEFPDNVTARHSHAEVLKDKVG